MSSSAFALVAAIVALLATGVVAAAVRRGRRATEKRLTEGLREVGSRMDGLARELGVAVEKVREDALRARIVESLGQALDLDEVLARCAEAAAALHGVARAVVAVEVDGDRMTASAGQTGAAVDPSALGARTAGIVGGPPDGRPVRAVGISYHYPAGAAETGFLRSAIAVPLVSEDRQLGFLTVFGRSEDPPVTGDDFLTLEAIAGHTGPAIERARQRQPSHGDEETDPLTRLGNRLALHETLAREVARAHRHTRTLCVCTFDLDDFRDTNERIGQIGADVVLAEVAALLRETIRPGDTAYRSGGDEFAVVMPGARRIDGEALFARLQGTLGRRVGSTPVIALSAGIAELKPDDDGVSLYARAERALQQAKQTGKGTAA